MNPNKGLVLDANILLRERHPNLDYGSCGALSERLCLENNSDMTIVVVRVEAVIVREQIVWYAIP